MNFIHKQKITAKTKHLKFLAVAVATSVLLNGCASFQSNRYLQEPAFIDESLAEKGVSEVRFVREDAVLQMLADVNLELNGQPLGSLSNNRKLVKQLPPGEHTILSDMGGLDFSHGCEFKLSLEPGEIKYVSLAPSTSGALPILSILFNPMVCKFDLTEESYKAGKFKFENAPG